MQIPEHEPSPKVKEHQPDDGGRPAKGEPGESDWFGKKIREFDRNGPGFGLRKDEYLPYLVIRSNPGDRGARPVKGVFWESPDILLAPGHPDSTPLMPASVAGVAKASAPTTLYAHVWNLGRAPVWGAMVEFYWFNPSLGFNYESAHRVGCAMVDLGDRFTSFPEWRETRGPAGDSYLTRGSHAIVKCPTAWVPTWENNGHECLVVRVFEPLMDGTARTSFDARRDRHIGQRNIAVVPAQSPAAIDLALDVARAAAPSAAEVEVSVEEPESMPWLKLYLGPGGKPLRKGGTPIAAGILPPSVSGARRMDISRLGLKAMETLLRRRERFLLGCERVQISFHAAADLDTDQAHVVRVRQRTEGVLVGGYTVVLVKHAR